MDESGRKILIGIIIAIVAGVGLYFLAFDVVALPGDAGISGQNNNAGSDSGRPMGDGVISPEASVVSEAMIGTWQSVGDPKFTREFRGDGTVIDRYQGDASATKDGIWGAFTTDMAAAGTSIIGLVEGVVYLQITINDASLYFSVVRAADTLETVYLDGGGQLNFTRVQ